MIVNWKSILNILSLDLLLSLHSLTDLDPEPAPEPLFYSLLHLFIQRQ